MAVLRRERPLILAPNRASAGDVSFDRFRIPGVRNFARAGDGDFQCFGYRNLSISCPGRRDFGCFGLQSARI